MLELIVSVFYATLKYELVMSQHQKLKTWIDNTILLEQLSCYIIFIYPRGSVLLTSTLSLHHFQSHFSYFGFEIR